MMDQITQTDAGDFTSIPEIRLFQLDSGNVGNIQNSVNLFRGDVTFPLTLASLPGRNGLDVTVTALYSSHVQDSVDTWNLDAPTGALGLGWSLAFDAIVANTNGSSALQGTNYYLLSQGTSTLLVQTGVDPQNQQVLVFAAQDYQFWQISYFTSDERWEIIKEDGVVYTYGGTSSSTQYGIRWGNWTGSSSESNGQQQYAVAWNLSSVRHFWGDTIQFVYENDMQSIGSGLQYTRASYLSQITDVYGRMVQFSYAPKESYEYQAPHQISSSGNAYQDQYETRFLESIQVNNPQGETLFSLQFGYDLINASLFPNDSNFEKRYLTSVTQVYPGSKARPGLKFAYATDATDVHRGALQTITYPEGGTATYTYQPQPLVNSQTLATAVSISSPGGTPRIWFADDYVVVTWYDDSGNGTLYVTPYTWGGSWLSSPNQTTISGKIALESLVVATGPDFFALSFNQVSDGTPQLYLFNQNLYSIEEWNYKQFSFDSSSGAATSISALAVGDTFVVFNPYGSSIVYQYTWNLIDSTWDQQSPIDTAGSSYIAVAAQNNYYVVFGYATSTGSNTALTLAYHDGTNNDGTTNWFTTPINSNNIANIYLLPTNNTPIFNWSMGTTYAVASYVQSLEPAGAEQSTVNYTVTIYTWDETFQQIDEVSFPYSYTVQNTTSVPFPAAGVYGDLVGSAQHLLRYDGVNWHAQDLTTDAVDLSSTSFAYGSDLAVMATIAGDTSAAYQFDPTSLTWMPVNNVEPAAGPPTISGNFFTLGTAIYYYSSQSGWGSLNQDQALPQGVNLQSVQNQANTYIAFEVGTGGDAQAQIMLLANGQTVKPISLDTERIFTPDSTGSGTNLVGTTAFVTYPSDAESFDTAQSLQLYRVVNNAIDHQDDYPVISLTVSDGYPEHPPVSTAYGYESSVAIYDPSGSVAQYPIVQVYPGLSQAPAQGDPIPNGYTELYFFNGVRPGMVGMFDPTGDGDSYYSLLGGQLVSSKTFGSQSNNSQSNMVGHSVNYWQVQTSNADGPIPGAYLQVTRGASTTEIDQLFELTDPDGSVGRYLKGIDQGMPTELSNAFSAQGFVVSQDCQVAADTSNSWVIVDPQHYKLYFVQAVSGSSSYQYRFFGGVTKIKDTCYDPASGLVHTTTTYNRNADSTIDTIVQTNQYAWNYNDPKTGAPVCPGMAEQHLLTPILRTTTTVNGSITTADTITTYPVWTQQNLGWLPEYPAPGAQNTNQRWATHIQYQALGTQPDGSPLDFDFTQPTQPQPGWLQINTVSSRTATGLAQETIDLAGVHRAMIFDQNAAYQIGTFVNASLAGQEASYYGCEPYEPDAGWRVQPGNTPPAFALGDAHTGTQSIQLPPAAQGGLQKQIAALQPTNQNAQYLFSCWYKTQDNAGVSTGAAEWQVSAAASGGSAGPFTAPMADTQGQWRFLFLVVDLSALLPNLSSGEGIAVTLLASNQTTTPILLDELRFSPYVGSFGARVYDPYYQVPNATLGNCGETRQYVRDAFQTVVATVGPDANVQTLSGRSYSRAGNGDSFAPDQPNNTLRIQAAQGGVYQNFAISPQWQQFWQGTEANWKVANGALLHSVTAVDSLSLLGSDTYTNYGIQFTVRPQELLTAPLGIAIGSNIAIRWTPGVDQGATGAWELYDLVQQQPILPPIVPLQRTSLSLFYQDAFAQANVSAASLALAVQALAGQGILVSATNVTIDPLQTGSQWLVNDPDQYQSYSVTLGADGLAVTQLTLDTTSWLLIIANNALLFYVDGQPICSHQCSTALPGPLTLFSGNQVAYSDVIIVQAPEITVTYQDGSSQPIQSLALEEVFNATGQGIGNNCIATGTVYDPLGRAAIKTKSMRYANTLLDFQRTFASAPDWIHGILQGDVATYYGPDGQGFSNDAGYPYMRTLFEDSPQSRVVASGNPGSEFGITDSTQLAQTHAQQYAYAANTALDVFYDAKQPLSGEFYVRTATDPNGVTSYTLKDKLGRTLVKKTVTTAADQAYTTIGYSYDLAGNLVTINLPMFYADSGAESWKITMEYDFLGRLTQRATPDETYPTRFLYDQANRCRFMQDANGQDPNHRAPATPYLLYTKYDWLSRLIEVGYLESPWDEANLQTEAEDPTWPQNGVWCRRLLYDGDGSSATTIGRLWKVQMSTQGNAEADVEETYAYDLHGWLTSTTISATAYDGNIYTTQYAYDNLGRVTAVTYPDATGGAGAGAPQVIYNYNSLGQLIGIGPSIEQPNGYAAYTYNAANRVASEVWNGGSGQPLQRTYAYNSPGWPTQISDAFFTQALQYTPQAAGNNGYYDGHIAASAFSFLWPNAPTPYTYEYQYDNLDQLTVADSALQSGNLGVGKPVTYDANGNFQVVQSDSAVETYTYSPGTNRVENIDGSGGADITYDAVGNIVGVSLGTSQGAISNVSYTPVTMLPAAMTVGSNGNPSSTLTFTYGALNQRVLKVSQSAGAASAAKLYLHGGNPYPLVELSGDAGNASPSMFIYGPGGLLAMRQDDKLYYICKDHERSTRAVIDVSGSAPTVAAAFDYDPFGGLLRSSGDTTLLNYRYTGQEYDGETGLYNYRARMYDPSLRRFYAPDPAGQFASPYLYAGNDPLRFLDPTGQSVFSSIGHFFKNTIVKDVIGFYVSVAEIAAGITLDVFSLGTASEVGGGTLIGAGINGLTYTATHLKNFSWSAFGVQEAIGAVVGSATAGIGAAMSGGAEAGANVASNTLTNALADTDDAGAAARALSGRVENAAQGLGGRVDSPEVEMSDFSGRGQCELSDNPEDAPACFVAGTEVLTEHGLVPIEDIKAGDLVWAFDEESSESVLCRVLEGFKRTTSRLVILMVDGTQIQTTPEHPFWVTGRGWVPAEDLQAEDTLMSRDGMLLHIDVINQTEGRFIVFNVEVEGAHTYYVSVKEILVHNPCSSLQEMAQRVATRTPAGRQQVVQMWGQYELSPDTTTYLRDSIIGRSTPQELQGYLDQSNTFRQAFLDYRASLQQQFNATPYSDYGNRNMLRELLDYYFNRFRT
jgi:RHS repeat-associated protein